MITIVSGLPRCGTSLMMRMLEMGGMPVLVDGVREADVDNPRGYYEYERVKAVKEDSSFLLEAEGKAVKMVSQLLYDLPADRTYKVVFMQREMKEMMASQNKMLERLGQPPAADDGQMIEFLGRHLAKMETWLAGQAHIGVLYVSYNALMKEPEPDIRRVAGFLGGALDTEGMRQAIDPQLYRQRNVAS